MKKILVLGAGLSASYLIKYLLDHAAEENWEVTVADTNPELAKAKVHRHSRGKAITLNVTDNAERGAHIAEHDIVISLLPPTMHILAARDCIRLKKHLVTASYVSEEMKQLDVEARNAGVLLLNECGLDPGIDHLSAMKMIHEVKEQGGAVTAFKSFCGGLVAPEFDDNPWNYKFTWNPRNVVLAGQATARYLENGVLKFIPPSQIFVQTEQVPIAEVGAFESYANRDSLGYIEPYGITEAQTVLRGTLRRQGYSEAWNQLVRLGLTDDSFTVYNNGSLTLRRLVNAFVPGTNLAALEERTAAFLGIDRNGELFGKLEWLGIFSEQPVTQHEATPAQILQQVLQHKWKLQHGELDMIVMYHELSYTIDNSDFKTTSALVVKGEDEVLTAMAKTVGLPMAIAAKLILSGKISARGVQMPLADEFYLPILEELSHYGISFEEHTEPAAR
jgi:saccharopine dehydrogenase-like NADP-dependent oxidoreductase